MSDSQGGFYRSGNYGQSRFSTDQGPPYIVKLLHLPVSCDDAFIDDLFSSRYTRKVKAKIVYDPSSNPLETGVVKKVLLLNWSPSVTRVRLSIGKTCIIKVTAEWLLSTQTTMISRIV